MTAMLVFNIVLSGFVLVMLVVFFMYNDERECRATRSLAVAFFTTLIIIFWDIMFLTVRQ